MSGELKLPRNTLTLDKVNRILEEKGVSCRCVEYNHGQVDSMFTCEKCGNHFYRTWGNVQRSIRYNRPVLCRNCSRVPDWNIDKIKKICTNYNLTLVSEKYVGIYEPLDWVCSCGNPFTRSWGHVMHKNRYLCKKCVNGTGTEWNIDKVLEKSQELGLVLLSREYVNFNSGLKWMCSNCGESYDRSLAHMLNNPTSQCKDCNGKTIWTIPKISKICDEIGIIFLDNHYINKKTPMNFQCSCGNPFTRNWGNIIATKDIGVECLDCSNKHRDSKIARYTKKICKETFESTVCEAKLVKNPDTGRWLFYDVMFVFNNQKYIIEVHGIQHYYFSDKFHKTVDNFNILKIRDAFKKQWALDNDYIFIEIDIRKFNKKSVAELIQKIKIGEYHDTKN